MTPSVLEQAKDNVFQKLQAMKKSDAFTKGVRALFAFANKTPQ
jgi:hypothetical protein